MPYSFFLTIFRVDQESLAELQLINYSLQVINYMLLSFNLDIAFEPSGEP